jgi:hypothetical protein|tara:strand:+ start:337 stop:978 length:642 start_codon:yes stop_codon:yes gene_type:complete
MNTKIPKIIHQLWVGDKPIPEHIKEFTDAMPIVNPNYECKLWGNEVFEKYSDDPFLTNYLKEPELYKWAFICDRIRCLLLNEIGGIYVDADAKPVQSFDLCMNQLGENITFFTGLKPTQQNNTLFDCAVYGSAPNSRMIKNLLATYSDIQWANGCKIFSDRIIQVIDADVGCFGYEYFYDDKMTDKTIVLHDVEETRLLSWAWDDEHFRRENW